MKKLLLIFAFFISIIGSLNAQTFQGVSDMFEYALYHFMTVYPDTSYHSYFPQPGEPYYVAVSLPDSCEIEKTFPKEKFPDVVFCEEREIPLKLRFRARCVPRHRYHLRRRTPAPAMHLITYYLEDTMFTIQINDLTIHREMGRVVRIGVCGAGCIYGFEQQKDLGMWTLYKAERCGVKYRCVDENKDYDEKNLLPK